MRKLYLFAFALFAFVPAFCQSQLGFPQPEFWFEARHLNDSLLEIPDDRDTVYVARFSDNVALTKGMMNYHPCISIDNMIGSLDVDYVPKEGSNITVFAVYEPAANKEEYSIWSLQLDTIADIYLNTQSLKSIDAEFVYSDTTTDNPLINLFRCSWVDENVDSLNCGFNMLSKDTLSFNGKFAELMFYDTPLNNTELSKVYTYLAIRYGISIKTVDYTSSLDSVVWDADKNIDFSNEIAGLGRDSILKIDQKQSCALAGRSVLTISVGEVQDWNSENQNEINPYDFLIWGDNGQEMSFMESDTLSPGLWNGVSGRKWLMMRSGATASGINTNLRIYCPEVADSSFLMLLVNSDANFDFPVDGTMCYYPDSVDNDGYWFFSNITWDTDSSGNDAFAFQNSPVPELAQMSIDGDEGEDALLLDMLSESYNGESNPGSISDVQNDDVLQNASAKIEYVSLYPNPTLGDFDIDLELSESSSIIMEIYDQNARILKKEYFEDQQKFHIREYIQTRGTYFIVLRSNEEVKLLKIVVN